MPPQVGPDPEFNAPLRTRPWPAVVPNLGWVLHTPPPRASLPLLLASQVPLDLASARSRALGMLSSLSAGSQHGRHMPSTSHACRYACLCATLRAYDVHTSRDCVQVSMTGLLYVLRLLCYSISWEHSSDT